MTAMNIDATLARISAIQSRMVAVGMLPQARFNAPASAMTGPAFAAALSEAQAAPDAQSAPAGSVTGGQVVASAEKYLGVPYVFGGTSNSGLDCSGLVQKAYGDLGISLPRVAADQAHAGTAVPSLAQAQPGDILAFGDPAYHVAIYLGNNMMIAAPEPGDHVKIQSVYQTPTSIRRMVGTDAGSGLSLSSVPAAEAGVAQYGSLFAQNEQAYQLPAGLLAAVAQTESGGDAGAVSPAGAQGLMQLMPSTASGLGVNPWDPAQAVRGAAQLLSDYLHRYGSVPLALAAYNAGPGAVDQYGGVPPYRETQNYVAKITALLAGSAA
jgi:cell wall-associated NlpC family hydrolase